eukprot:gene1329-32686_t
MDLRSSIPPGDTGVVAQFDRVSSSRGLSDLDESDFFSIHSGSMNLNGTEGDAGVVARFDRDSSSRGLSDLEESDFFSLHSGSVDLLNGTEGQGLHIDDVEDDDLAYTDGDGDDCWRYVRRAGDTEHEMSEEDQALMEAMHTRLQVCG